ncbi:MAG: hypothetical protein GXP42_11050 [Chloroflexi bacterium]|nr:hypothetical protein [Chloroflexota bacterium]
MLPPTTTTIPCPHCGAQYQAPIFHVVDVGETPELKQVVLAGQLNASQCPHCRQVNYVAAPLLYHDPEHEFLAVFIPPQLNLSENQRQKLIGDLTKALMDSLPAEKRRGYMLTPQQFLTMDSLLEKLLGFEGVTPEMLEASRKKAQLVEELARIQNDGIAFNVTVKENEALLDEEFFRILRSFQLSAQAEAREEAAKSLAELEERLLPITEFGRKVLKQRQAVERLGERPTRRSVLEAILKADMDEAEAIAVAARPLMDYSFFLELAERIEALPPDEREAQEAKRERILEVLNILQAADQQVLAEANQVLQTLLAAPDMEKAVREMLPYIDQTVMTVLLANIEEAQQRGATAASERLKELWRIITETMEQAIPPEIRLLYLLTEAEYPQGVKAVLQEHKEEITPEFLDFLRESIEAIEKQAADDENQKAVARHLRNVLTLAQLGV